MAHRARSLPQNADGDFFVDSSCIDCDACRQIAPGVFRDHGDQSSVYRQPGTDDEARRALMALVACPTGSIGTSKRYDARLGVGAFPMPVDANIYYCGFNAESSFGAWSYLIVRPESEGGNVLVDSPRWALPLVKKIEALGGIASMLLTHRDDIADHDRYAGHFACQRVMHADDGAARLRIEQVVEGDSIVELDCDLTLIPTPGHTRGSVMFLYGKRYLLTGDSLAWDPDDQTLTAFRDACWYSWSRQTHSLERLLEHPFEWVLPGHGRIGHASAAIMRAHLVRCLEWMKSA